MFGFLRGGFDEPDPFFANPNQLIHQMDSMMNSMMQGPFQMGMLSGMHQGAIMPHQNHSAMMPLGSMMGFPMAGPFGMSPMGQMFHGFGQQGFSVGSAPAFSSSSIMTMSTGPDGQPQVYQASTTTRTAPGGVREVHRSVSDSRSGIRKMAVGRHLGERGHVLEKEQNLRTGDAEEREDFINIEEEEVQQFDDEWNQRTRSHQYHSRPRLEMSRNHHSSLSESPLAITAGPSHHEEVARSRHSIHPRGVGPDRNARKRDNHRSGKNRHETSM